MRFFTKVLTGALALAVAAGCSDDGKTGKLNVVLTDAPFPFDQVARVDVFVVRIDAKAPEVDSSNAANESDSNGWVTVASPNSLINLLDLQGGKTTNLGATSLTTGTYKGFRLIIDTDKSSVTLKDGTKPTIKWPSAGKSGIKINLDQPVNLTDAGATLLVDFDVGRSFVMRGNTISQNGLLFKPVLRATATVTVSTGTVSGTVRGDAATGPLLPGVSIELLKSGTSLTDTVSANVIKTGSTDTAGAFRLTSVLPGTYTLRATPAAASGYKALLYATPVVVTAGQETAGIAVVVVK
jgi:hypothetical protein